MMDFKINEKDRISTGFKAPDDYFATLADRISLPEPVSYTHLTLPTKA